MFKTCSCPMWEQSILFLIVEENADCILFVVFHGF